MDESITNSQIASSMPKPQKSRWVTFFNAIGHISNAVGKTFSLLFYLFLIAFLFGGSGLFGSSESSGPKVLYGSGEDQIAVIDINGIISEQDDSQSGVFSQSQAASPRRTIEIFEQIKQHPEVKAVILRINSPGGSVTASEEMYQLILNYKQQLNIPVVASLSDVAASGGYYVALAADQIISSPATLTGSIGVIFQTYNYQELAQKVGVKDVVIKSGPNKDLMNPFHEVSAEQVQILQSIIDEAYQQFTQHVVDRRGIDRSLLPTVADGRVLSGQQALSYRLVDRVGTFQDTVQFAQQKANIQSAQVVIYGQKGLLESFLGSLLSNFNLTSKLNVGPKNQLSGTPAYLYLP